MSLLVCLHNIKLKLVCMSGHNVFLFLFVSGAFWYCV